MTKKEAFEILSKLYFDLQKLNVDPGQKAHTLWHSVDWVKRQMNKILKELEE